MSWDQVEDCFPVSFIGPGAQETPGLMKKKANRGRGTGRSLPDDAHIVPCLYNRREIANEMAIYGDLAGSYQSLAGASRTETRRGQKTIQAHLRARMSGKRERRNDSPRCSRLDVGLRFWQTNHGLTLLKLAALFHHLDALEALKNAAFRFDGALALQARMLAHRGGKLAKFSRKATEISVSPFGCDEALTGKFRQAPASSDPLR